MIFGFKGKDRPKQKPKDPLVYLELHSNGYFFSILGKLVGTKTPLKINMETKNGGL